MTTSIAATYRGIAVEPSFWDLENRPFDPEQYVRLAHELHANAIRVGFFGHTGLAYYPSKIAPHAPGLEGRDLLKEFQHCCSKYSLTLVPYVNTHFDKHYYQKHPEAVSVLDGKPGLVEGTPLVKVCLNNPEYRDYTFSVAAELVREYSPDVLYIDSLKLEHLCQCPWCKSLLHQSTGLDLPADADWADPAWTGYLNWYQNRYLELAAICAENIRNIKPDIELISNRESFFNQITSTPQLNKKLAHEIFNNIHAEAAVRLNHETYSHITAQCLFGQAMRTPIWLWVEYCHGRWMYFSCSSDEMVLKLAKVVSSSGRPNLWTLTDIPESAHNAREGIARIYSMMAEYPECFDNTEHVSETAQLYSTISRQYYVRGCEPFVWPYTPDKIGKRYEQEFIGLFQMGLLSHSQLTFILDEDVNTDQLSQYRAIVLPNVGSMTDAQCQAVRDYVSAGGGLIATYETSLYDAAGNSRGDFALADLFGVSYAGDGKEAGDFQRPFSTGGYLSPTPDNAVGLAADDLHLASGRTLTVKPTGGNVTANLIYPGWYHLNFNALPQNNPGLICNTYGKGRVAYLPFEFGYGFASEEPFKMVELFKSLLSWLSAPPIVQTNLPAIADIFLRRTAGGDLIVHIINLPSDRPVASDKLAPLTDIEIQLSLPDDVGDCQILHGSGGKGLTWNNDGTTLHLTISEVTDYLVIQCKTRNK